MFAIFGLGTEEIIILGIIGVLMLGVPLVAIFIAMSASRQARASENSGAVAQLREEVQRLREEIERLKKGSA